MKTKIFGRDADERKKADIKDDSRCIYLFEEICGDSAEDLIRRLHYLEKKSNKPITIFINSPGGDCAAGFAMIDALLISKCLIITVGTGEVCSMAPAVFMAGRKRYITEHTYFMFHPVTAYSSDYIQFAKSRLKNAEDVEKLYDDFILSRCKITKTVYKQAKNKELWLNSKVLIEYKIADGLFKGVKK